MPKSVLRRRLLAKRQPFDDADAKCNPGAETDGAKPDSRAQRVVRPGETTCHPLQRKRDDDRKCGHADQRADAEERKVGDPMTLYLRDVGGTVLLTRAGEAALAKRLEAGRRMMRDGLGVILPAITAVSAWRDAIREGALRLRDVIDVGAAYDAGHRLGRRLEHAGAVEDAHPDADGFGEDRPRLAAMEAEVFPAVMESLDGIAASYPKLRWLQEKRLEVARRNRTLTVS